MSINIKTTTIFISFFFLALFLFNSKNVFALSCTQVGDTSFCDDGTYYTQVGNTTFGSDGTTYSKIGNTTSLDRCPYNSFQDSVTKKCKCNNGYLSSGGSCVPANSVCSSQLGYQSSYDSISKKCKCNSGYIIGTSGQCINANNYCVSQIGIMSSYNSISNQCECTTGYEFNGSSCIRKNTNYSNISVVSPSLPSVSVNTNDQVCQDSYGVNSFYSGETNASKGGVGGCSCKSGFQFKFENNDGQCVSIPKATTPVIKKVSEIKTAPNTVKVNTTSIAKPDSINLNQAVTASTPTEVKPKSLWQKIIGWLGF